MSMHPVLTRYFALVDAISNGIQPGKVPDEDRTWGSYATCPACYAEKDWDKKLGVILAEHGVDLEEFARERFSTFGDNMFVVEDGKLKFRQPVRCVSLEALLHTAAKLLPSAD